MRDFLLSHDVKMIIIACNTSSACSYEQVKSNFDIPVLEVIRPGSVTAVRETRNKKVGVIGTAGTISSGVYENVIEEIDSSIKVYSQACPLFVQLAEEGWWDNDIALRTAQYYLKPLVDEGIDTLVLGCTHYPLLYKTISKVMGDEVKLVSSGLGVARMAKELIQKNNIESESNTAPEYSYYTSDSVEKFEKLGSLFLGKDISSAQKIDIEKY